jgi:anti-sigma B factor antagonist
MTYMVAVLTFRLTHEPTGSMVAVSGDVDYATAPQVREQVLLALRQGSSVHLDLRDVSFMDSAGIHLLVSGSHRARAMGGHLCLIGSSRPVRRLLTVAGFEPWPVEGCVCATIMESW